VSVRPEIKELAPIALGTLSILAIALGVPYPAVGAGTAIGIEAAKAAKEFVERRNARRAERLVGLIGSLSAQVGGMRRGLDEEEVDLFLEVTSKAVEDDEDDKLIFYRGILDWILDDRPTPAQVRILSDAVRTLSFVELAMYIRHINRVNYIVALQKEIDDKAAWYRIESLGLAIAVDGVSFSWQATELGMVLSQRTTLDEVRRIDEARQSKLRERAKAKKGSL